MARATRIAAIATGAAVLGAVATGAPALARDPDSLRFRAEMVGNVTTDPPVFGVNRAGAPWVFAATSRVSVRDGNLKVDVNGLTLTNGTNPLTRISASLACNGAIVVTTATFPFSAAGNADINADITVPARCLAPAVFLNPNGNAGTYIAVNGSMF